MRLRTRPSDPSFGGGTPTLKTVVSLCVPLFAGAVASSPHAQEPAPAPPDNPAYVLHLDSRMAQVPTLFLSKDEHPVPPLDPQHISIAFDAGPRFHPSRIRLQGDDPITLGLLIDVSGSVSDLLPALTQDFSTWVGASLKPQDHVSIYSLDCALFQTDSFQSSLPSVLQRDLDAALSSPLPHGSKSRPACSNSIRLRDSMGIVMTQLSKLPGRRVLLVISDGFDRTSHESWEDLRVDAATRDVSVFAMTPDRPLFSSVVYPLCVFTHQSGGLCFRSSPKLVDTTLPGFIKLLRERDILEFPMSPNFTGNHIINVTMDNGDAIILPAGFAIVPIAAPLPPVDAHP